MVQMIHNNTDMILISETNLNTSFPSSQSEIEGYTKNLLNGNAKG